MKLDNFTGPILFLQVTTEGPCAKTKDRHGNNF